MSVGFSPVYNSSCQVLLDDDALCFFNSNTLFFLQMFELCVEADYCEFGVAWGLRFLIWIWWHLMDCVVIQVEDFLLMTFGLIQCRCMIGCSVAPCMLVSWKCFDCVLFMYAYLFGAAENFLVVFQAFLGFSWCQFVVFMSDLIDIGRGVLYCRCYFSSTFVLDLWFAVLELQPCCVGQCLLCMPLDCECSRLVSCFVISCSINVSASYGELVVIGILIWCRCAEYGGFCEVGMDHGLPGKFGFLFGSSEVLIICHGRLLFHCVCACQSDVNVS